MLRSISMNADVFFLHPKIAEKKKGAGVSA
jgi:hypothetical protein